MKKKKPFRVVMATFVILLLVFSPFLIAIDYKRFGPFVVLFWFLAIAYFLFLKKKIDRFYGLTGSMDEDSRVGQNFSAEPEVEQNQQEEPEEKEDVQKEKRSEKE